MKRLASIIFILLYAIPAFSQTMEWHIKDNYTDIVYMGNDLFKVKNSYGKWGVINEYGELTVDVQYDSITHFVENRALLLDITGQFLKGIINERGQIIKTFSRNEIVSGYHNYSEGMLAYGVDNGVDDYYLFGYLDINGNTRIEPKYYGAAPFINGKAVVQYKSQIFGMIDNSGRPSVNDNRKIKFMSTPVNNLLLIAFGTSRGEKVTLVQLEPNGKLLEKEVLETGTRVSVSSDYKSISCQNGTSYYFDEAMRLINSSTGKLFNEPLVIDTELPDSPYFKKMRNQSGWNIYYAGNALLSTSFTDIDFCDNKYAVVTSKMNTMGVLKLNQSGNVVVQSVPRQVEFFHNEEVTGNVSVMVSGIRPLTKIQIGIVGLKENGLEEVYDLPAGYYGLYDLPIAYFIPADNFNEEVKKTVTVNLYIDGMLYNSEDKFLTGIHKNPYQVSGIKSPEYSDPDGNAVISFNVQSLTSTPSNSAKVIVRGSSEQTKRFNGKDLLKFTIPVAIPAEQERTFRFVVTIEEDGCPSYEDVIKSTIKHYVLL